MNNGPILADFLQHCQPAHFPGPWQKFVKSADVWCPPTNVETALAALREKYSNRQLVRTGLFVRTKQQSLEISPKFSLQHYVVLPLRKTPTDNPIDLLTDDGSVRGRLALYVGARDYDVREGIKRFGRLFVVFCLPDLLALRAVGMPTVLAHGLEQFTPDSLAEFRGAFAANGKNQSDIPQQLVLVGCSLARLLRHRAATLDLVVHNLTTSATAIGIDLQDVFLWMPETRELQTIANIVAIGGRKNVARAILESLDQSAKPLVASEETEVSIEEFSELSAKLRAELRRSSSNRGRVRRLLREFQIAVNKIHVQPILEMADQTSDVKEKSRLAGLVQLNEILHPTIMSYSAKLARSIAQDSSLTTGMLLENREVMKLFDALDKLTRSK